MTGFVHSFESLGAVDGPGLRYVVFMQGCPLRCAYCHNPDTWEFGAGRKFTVEEIVKNALRFRPYFGAEGGVTISGGEALSQSEFVARLCERLQENGIHTTLDTSGIGGDAQRVLKHTDLVLCDIKFPTNEMYEKHAKGCLDTVLDFLRLCEKMNVPVWVRHVVVPKLTDSEESVREIVRIASGFSNVQRIELLPFKKLCGAKYDEMGIDFPLRETNECSEETIKALAKLTPPEYK